MANKGIPKAKAKKVVQGLLDPSKSTAQALRDAGYTDTTALHNPAQVVGHPQIQELFIAELEKVDVNISTLARCLAEGLQAEKEISFIFNRIIERMGLKGNKKVEQMADEFTDDFISVPDFAVRHKYLETALKVLKLQKEQVEVTGDVLLRARRDELTEDEIIRLIEANKNQNGGGEDDN